MRPSDTLSAVFEIAQYLTVRRARTARAVSAAGVERQAEPLALLDDEGVLVAVVGLGSRVGAILRVGVGEQQVVRDVLVAGGGLLGQVVCPAQQVEHRADEVLLGGGLVRTRGSGQGVAAPPDLGPEGGELRCGVR